MFFFVFLQAEDGIRELVRSRGLGDVYKRQPLGGKDLRSRHPGLPDNPALSRCDARDGLSHAGGSTQSRPPAHPPVSYTHLTLPTIYSV